MKINKFWSRWLVQCCLILLAIWIYRQVRSNASKTASASTIKYNIARAKLGRSFFLDLIHNDRSFNDVNEHTVCSLMHFFFQEAAQNGKPVEFLSGMFILYDSTERFFTQLMIAKNNQLHSDEHRSGYFRRPAYFFIDLLKSLFNFLRQRKTSFYRPFIYLRGDESSHFHERGNKHDRWHLYPAYGIDMAHGCMPNGFSHILFGKLRSLANNTSRQYSGDRIYIKPEASGLQQFPQYLAHANHYIRAVSYSFLCRFIDNFTPQFCTPTGAFHEWVDRRLAKRWTQILATIKSLAQNERRQMQDQVFSEGILQIYRQSLLFPPLPYVKDFRIELEHRYGSDISARKANEIIFTTEQLLNSSPSCTADFSMNDKQQCVEPDVIIQ